MGEAESFGKNYWICEENKGEKKNRYENQGEWILESQKGLGWKAP